jgi:hypothetical protein
MTPCLNFRIHRHAVPNVPISICQVLDPAAAVTSKGDKSKKEFDGVPVFQSHHLALRAGNKRYCPIFFRYEDVEAALAKAKSREERTSKKMINQDHSIQVRRLSYAGILSVRWCDKFCNLAAVFGMA